MDFLTTVGAKKTSKDVHWPLTVSLRAPYAEGQRASGFSQRTKEADARRREKKASRGIWHAQATGASTSTAPAAPAAPAPDPSASAVADYGSGSLRLGLLEKELRGMGRQRHLGLGSQVTAMP